MQTWTSQNLEVRKTWRFPELGSFPNLEVSKTWKFPKLGSFPNFEVSQTWEFPELGSFPNLGVSQTWEFLKLGSFPNLGVSRTPSLRPRRLDRLGPGRGPELGTERSAVRFALGPPVGRLRARLGRFLNLGVSHAVRPLLQGCAPHASCSSEQAPGLGTGRWRFSAWAPNLGRPRRRSPPAAMKSTRTKVRTSGTWREVCDRLQDAYRRPVGERAGRSLRATAAGPIFSPAFPRRCVRR